MVDEPEKELVEHYAELLERAFGGRRWILALDVLAVMTGMVRRLEEFGAESALCVAASRGTGPLPDEAFAPDPIVFDVRGTDMMSGIRKSMARLADLPPDAITRIDEFDPDREARVIGPIFDDGRPLAGRAKYGARPPAWQAYEDKTVVDELWDRVGVPRSERRVVSSEDFDALVSASSQVDLGDGTVWVADDREGFHGGGSFARRVCSDDDARTAFDDLAPHCDEIRVMPFLEGIPCSIHGLVFDDYTVALRPCEMLVFRKKGSTRFHYGKASTFWDPAPEDRAEMRRIARRVGDHLRDEVDYRGAFTIDGIMTVDGFRPTELNPRYGAALGVLTSTIDIPMLFANLAIVEREPFDWRPRELEELIVRGADEHRAGSTMAIVPVRVEESTTEDLVFEDGVFRSAKPDDPVDAKLSLGPNATGAFLRVTFEPDRTPVGPPLASRAAAALAFADRVYGLGLGELQPAVAVR